MDVKKLPILTLSDRRHGTISGYTYWRCRCNKCLKAINDYQRRTRRAGPPPGAAHGTLGVYTNYGCRCDLCRGAASASTRKRRQAALDRAAKSSESPHLPRVDMSKLA